MTDGRKRLLGAMATLCISALGTSVFSATPSSAEPSIHDVRDRVDTLYHQAEQASERVNEARIRVASARDRLVTLRADLREQRREYGAVRDQVAATVQTQIEGHTLTAATELLLTDDPDAFISQLTTVDEYTQNQNALAANLADQADLLAMRRERAQRVVTALRQDRAALVEDKAAIDEKAAQAKALLDRLEREQAARQAAEQEAERAARVSRAGGRSSDAAPETAAPPVSAAPPAAAAVSGGAAAAVQFAMAQVGDAYVYGAAGPSAYDCSGLTMSAWAQAGVALPHSSSAQYASGTPVSASALAPGDLVFYYSPISHVALYVGNGMIVHAANPSTGVRMDPVASMPMAGAVRPG